jgi:hypothetical protein
MGVLTWCATRMGWGGRHPAARALEREGACSGVGEGVRHQHNACMGEAGGTALPPEPETREVCGEADGSKSTTFEFSKPVKRIQIQILNSFKL